jgi:hypothetical protein
VSVEEVRLDKDISGKRTRLARGGEQFAKQYTPCCSGSQRTVRGQTETRTNRGTRGQ